MPHVFTLEGANLSAEPVVSFPQAGSPLAPHGAPIGPARPPTLVFGPGGTPIMYRRRYPARGPVVDYCDPSYFTVMDGGQTVIPYQQQQLGDGVIIDFLRKQHPVVAGAMVLGGSLLTGLLFGGFAVWLLYKTGYRPKETETETEW